MALVHFPSQEWIQSRVCAGTTSDWHELSKSLHRTKNLDRWDSKSLGGNESMLPTYLTYVRRLPWETNLP